MNFGKVLGYKINKHKPAAFLFTNSELSEWEIKKKGPIDNYIKKNKIARNKSNQIGKSFSQNEDR